MSEERRNLIRAMAAAMTTPLIETVGDFSEYGNDALEAAVEVRLRQLLTQFLNDAND